MLLIAPSLLAADFTKLSEEITDVRNAGAEWLHYDVMDGHFVPNISMGVPVLESLRKCTDLFLDVHLMITEPGRYVQAFSNAGADLINVHVESDTQENLKVALKEIKECGKPCGITLKPGTSWEAALPYLELTDLILVMTVEPGFGGQHFMADMMPKLSMLRSLIDDSGRDIRLEVDGGVDKNTAPLCIQNGADVLVAGSSVFRKQDRGKAIAELRGIHLTEE